jgi:hypothetical protein
MYGSPNLDSRVENPVPAGRLASAAAELTSATPGGTSGAADVSSPTALPAAVHGSTVTYVEGLPPMPYAATHASMNSVTNEDLRGSIVRGYFADAPTLHVVPTIYVVGAAAAAVSLLTAFLQTAVMPSNGHLTVFFFGAFTCFSSYYMAAHFLGEHARSFQRISPDKKLYTVSNLIKAGVLAAIMPMGLTALRDGMLYDVWNTNMLRNLGCVYAIPDFVSIIVVRRMAPSTYAHHICVVVFCFLALYNDFAQANVFRLLAVYGAFSTAGYITYMLLASRFLGVSAGVARWLSLIALVVYVACCCTNWIWQLTYLKYLYFEQHHWSIYVYLGVITLVVYDDLQLCRWLFRRARSQRAPIGA